MAPPVRTAPVDERSAAPARQPEPAAPAASVPDSVVLPIALPAPMPVEQLKAMLELAGLSLVQTEPDKLQMRTSGLSREPQPLRVPRERQVLPPPDMRPLIQIETRKGQ